MKFWQIFTATLQTILFLQAQATAQPWVLISGGPPPANGSRSWVQVASSADGRRLVAATTAGICTSTNSGTNWTLTSASLRSYWSVACSDDGSKLIALAAGDSYNSGSVFTSTDAGATWSSNNAPAPNNWFRVACSSDGTKLHRRA